MIIAKPAGFPQIVCLCGSTKFGDDFARAQFTETLKGNIVLSIASSRKEPPNKTPDRIALEALKPQLDALHMRKIDLAEGILVINKNNYIGESTRAEIEYAVQTGKTVRYLYPMN